MIYVAFAATGYEAHLSLNKLFTRCGMYVHLELTIIMSNVLLLLYLCIWLLCMGVICHLILLRLHYSNFHDRFNKYDIVC